MLNCRHDSYRKKILMLGVLHMGHALCHLRAVSGENQQCGFRTGLTNQAVQAQKMARFPNRFDTSQAVQSQKMARGWKFWM